MPAKGKGKRKVTTGPMDPRKTREPVTGHPDSDINAALDTVMLSPPHTDKDYDSDTSVVTTAPPLPESTIPAIHKLKAQLSEMQERMDRETQMMEKEILTCSTPGYAQCMLFGNALDAPANVRPYAMWLLRELSNTLKVELQLDPEDRKTCTTLADLNEATVKPPCKEVTYRVYSSVTSIQDTVISLPFM